MNDRIRRRQIGPLELEYDGDSLTLYASRLGYLDVARGSITLTIGPRDRPRSRYLHLDLAARRLTITPA